MPHSICYYLQHKYTILINQKVGSINSNFDSLCQQDSDKKKEHLRLFRPNLANPANKQHTVTLNTDESNRYEQFMELIDDTQMDLLDTEQDMSTEFYTSFLNNIRCLIVIFDAAVYKEDFIMLPGDEVVEKKHKNVKFLTAMDNGTDLGL